MAADPKPQRRGTKALLMASAVAQICALARYMVLARMLGPEQLGLAAILILTSQFFESVTDSGSDRFLVQDRAGNDPALLRLTHLVSLGRALLIAGGLVLFAGPIANLSGAPQLARDIMVLAIAPLIMGLVHWDYRRQQRESDFRGESRIVLTAEVVSLVATMAAVLWVRDYRAILYGLIARSLATVILSHIVARQRYGLGYNAKHAPRLARFAWPLMVNGLLIFIGGQGDRLFISNRLGVAELGHYSAVILLILYPAAMIMRFMTTMYLPRLSDAEKDQAAWQRAQEGLASQALLIALGMQFGFVLVAPFAVPLLFGPEFGVGLITLTAIAMLQSARFIRLWPVTTAMGAGRSHIVMVNNAVRMLAFPAALGGLMLMDGIEGIIGGFILAEWAALLTGLVMVNRALGRPILHDSGRFMHFLTGSTLLLLGIVAWQRGWAMVATTTGTLLLLWAIVLLRSERKALDDLLTQADRATGHRLLPRWIMRGG